MLSASAFMGFVRTGDRQVYELPYFERRRKLIGAVLAECVSNDGSYMGCIIDGLWCICEESTWVVSAHNGSSHRGMRPQSERPLPDIQNPYIDLFAAQTAATLSYALYFLEDALDNVSPLITRRVRLELERRIFLPFMTRDDFWWMGMIRRDVNNWTPWILSNVIDSMLIVFSDQQRLCEGLARSMRMLDSYLDIMPADGGCDEGCGYWNMSGGSLLDCLESLYLASGGKINFYAEPHIKNIGAFPVHSHIHGSYFLNFADCDARPILDGERVYRFGQRTGNIYLMNLGAQIYAALDQVKPHDTPQMNRVLYSLFADIPPGLMADTTSAQDTQITLPDLQVYAWRKNGLYAAIKGGHNGENHNHNDVGSFMVYAQGEPCIIDAGNIVYTAKTFSDERYTIWNTRAYYHNIALIGEREQHSGIDFKASDIRLTDNSVQMQLSGCYDGHAKLDSYTRKLTMLENEVSLCDNLLLSEPAPITWVFMLRNEPQAIDDGRITLGPLTFSYAAPLEIAKEEIPVTDSRMHQSFPGSLWRLTLKSLPDTRHEQVFRMTRS